MDNYDYCAQWVLDQQPTTDARALDYGCGAGHIPFPDASFDFVTSNQVFEHVADPDAVLAEITRVRT